MPLRNYRELDVWKRAMDLAECVYGIAERMPARERFVLTHQMCKAAVSIPSNIAEGYGRSTRRDYVHFLHMARGSLLELETQLTLAARLKFLKREHVLPAWSLAQDTGRMLLALIKSLQKRTITSDD